MKANENKSNGNENYVEDNKDNNFDFEKEIPELVGFKTHLQFDRLRKEICQFETDNNRLQMAKLLFYNLNRNNSNTNSNSSNNYTKQNSNYFGNMYAFLIYQKEIIQQMMQFCDNNRKKFDFLFTIHAFLDYVCQPLILLYCCCDFEFICIFYPFLNEQLEHVNVIECFVVNK